MEEIEFILESVQWTTGCPGLMIYLTDNSVYSSHLINRSIDYTIQVNFGGDRPRNRCFIMVISYTGEVKEICSGWLQDLDESPLRRETLNKMVSDGAGGIVEVKCIRPVWVEPIEPVNNGNADNKKIIEAFKLVNKHVEDWKFEGRPTPIVFDLNCCLSNVNNQIDLEHFQKQCFVFGVTRSIELINKLPSRIYSIVPEEWIHRSYRKPSILNMHGVLTSNELLEVISQQ